MGLMRLLATDRPLAPSPDVERSTFDVSDWASYVTLVTGGSVTDERARRAAAAYACIDVLSSSVATTPIDVVTSSAAGRQHVDHPLVEQPSLLVEADTWRYQVMESLGTDGNAFGLISTSDPLFRSAESIELVDPSIVTNRTVKDGIVQATIAGEVHRRWPHGDLWHVPGKMVRAGSPWGRSPIADAARSIKTSLAAEQHVDSFFAEGAHPTAIISAKTPLTAEQSAQIKTGWRKMIASGGREPAVMGGDLDYEAIQISPKDSQPIDLMRWEVEQQCRFWRVPPEMVFAAVSGQSVTYSNVTQRDLNFLKYSLNVYLVRIEGALAAVLPKTHRAKFNRTAILQSDPHGRHQIHEIRLRNKLATVNEIRELEDQAPFSDPAFDIPGVPGGVTPATTAPTPGDQ